MSLSNETDQTIRALRSFVAVVLTSTPRTISSATLYMPCRH